MASNAAVAAYVGSAAKSAMLLGLGEAIVKMNDEALRTLTSAMPLIEGLPGITGIGYGGHIDAGTEVSSAGVPNLRDSGQYLA